MNQDNATPVTESSKILIVDDNPTNLAILFDYLDAANFRVFVAEDGESAIEQVYFARPDIILLDVMMPGIDGFETCRRLKNNPDTKDIPVIFMTALTDTADKITGFEAGAVDYVTKPLHNEEVLARVNIHLTIQRLKNNLANQNKHLKQEVIARTKAETELYHRAFHDALTNLPNRTLFTNHLERVIERNQEENDKQFAVLFVDLDRFKIINDSMGHMVGDQLLTHVARRLETCVRNDDVVARLGGDEFAILLDSVSHISEAEQIAIRIQNELARPLVLESYEIFTTASIGITFSNNHYTSPDDFLRDADMAMYQAKTAGKARHALFDASQRHLPATRLQLESELWQALDRNELKITYQPILSLIDGKIVAAETVLNWAHPKRGTLLPNEFMHLAEETGLIEPIGNWLLGAVCSQMGQWYAAGYASISTIVPVSTRQFQSQSFVGMVKKTLEDSGIPPRLLTLDITENTLSNESSVAKLNKLNAIGIKFSINDFGLDSSLKCLKSPALSILKINRTFVNGITTTPSDRATIVGIISMAHSLDLKVLAEGIETRDQVEFLRQQKCDEMQGTLLFPPLSIEKMTRLLQDSEASSGIPLVSQEFDLSTFAHATRHIGYALVKDNLTILAHNSGFNNWFPGETNNLVEKNLTDLLPELLALEDELYRIAHDQAETLIIPKIYRPSENGFGHYFDLQIETFRSHEATLLVMLTDMTEQARLEFELRQERNELLLHIIQNSFVKSKKRLPEDKC